MRLQDFAGGGEGAEGEGSFERQKLRTQPSGVTGANQADCNEDQDRLKFPESFWLLMLKYALSHILETLFLSFLHLVKYPKLMKMAYCTSVNLRYFLCYYTLSKFPIFWSNYEKVMPLIM